MTPPIPRKVAPFVFGFLLMLGALSAAAEDAVLQISVIGAGAGSVGSRAPSVLCSATCSATTTLGETLRLTATPAPRSAFESWAGDCSGIQPTCTLKIDGTNLAIASFKPTGDPYSVVAHFGLGKDEWPPVYGELMLQGGYLYGVTRAGGRTRGGSLFRVLPDGSHRRVLHNFVGGPSDGHSPSGSATAVGADLYGMTERGGAADSGTIYKINSDGSGFTLVHSFTGGASGGVEPIGSLIEYGGTLYGMTSLGGAGDCRRSDRVVVGCGTIFKLRPDGTGFAVLHSFGGGAGDGAWPSGSLVEYGGTLYGMTLEGGTGRCRQPDGAMVSCGTTFKLKPDGSGFMILHSFASGNKNGMRPSGSLVVSSDVLYGMTSLGGPDEDGTIFRIGTNGKGFTLLHAFAYKSDGATPCGSLVLTGGAVYGMTLEGDAGVGGTIVKVDLSGSQSIVLHSFTAGDPHGPPPWGSLVVSGSALYGMRGGTLFRLSRDGSDFAVLYSYPSHRSDAYEPLGSLVESGGALYGSTQLGGEDNPGTIFKVSPDGTGLATVRSYASLGSPAGLGPLSPSESLVSSGGLLYGMTTNGGASRRGTVFRIKPDGSGFTLLHSFGGGTLDGSGPFGSLMEFGGALYGMTFQGGGNNAGTIFKVSLDGSGFALLHSFEVTDFLQPSNVSLLAFGGALFGVAGQAGPSDIGRIFRVNPDGTGFAFLHSFSGGASDGRTPEGEPMEFGGTLYGLTYKGGASDGGTVFRINPDGGGFALLHMFNKPSDGMFPWGQLVAVGGTLHGMTGYGGTANCPELSDRTLGCGTIFKIRPDGTGFSVAHTFRGGNSDGASPSSHLIPISGKLLGTASFGGLAGGGVVFALDLEATPARGQTPRP